MPSCFRRTESNPPRVAPLVDRFGPIAGLELLINAVLMFARVALPSIWNKSEPSDRAPGRIPVLLSGSLSPCTRALRRLYIRNLASSLVALPGIRAGPGPVDFIGRIGAEACPTGRCFCRGRPVFADRNGVVSRITVRNPAHGQFKAIARLAGASGIIGPKPSEKGFDLLSKE